MRSIRFALVLGMLVPAAAAAQSGQASDVGAACATIPVTFAADTRDFCYTVAQAVESIQPQLGIAVSGGNVTPGSATHGGIHLTGLPGLTITGKVAQFARALAVAMAPELVIRYRAQPASALLACPAAASMIRRRVADSVRTAS